MDWHPLQTTAKNRGQLVFAMRQSQLPMKKLPIIKQLTEGGFCIGLSVTWIAMQYEGEAFSVEGGIGGVCEWPPFRAVLYQNISKIEGEPDWTDFWDTAGRPEQLRLSDGLRAKRNTKPTADFIYSIVTKAYGCYGITMEGDAAAHAVAMRHGRDNRMHFFDPNFGQFVVADHTKLKAFLNWFFAQVPFYQEKLNTMTGVVGIKPPINAKDG